MEFIEQQKQRREYFEIKFCGDAKACKLTENIQIIEGKVID